jgi:hypothetical protein
MLNTRQSVASVFSLLLRILFTRQYLNCAYAAGLRHIFLENVFFTVAVWQEQEATRDLLVYA